MRLTWLTTEYRTGYPFITPGALIWAFAVVAVEAIFDHNQTGAGVAAGILAVSALSQLIMHRATLARERQADDG